jgi:hypothetical protein
MLIDATEQFYKSLVESIVNVLEADRETETEIDLDTFEKAYFNVTNESFLAFLSYFKITFTTSILVLPTNSQIKLENLETSWYKIK